MIFEKSDFRTVIMAVVLCLFLFQVIGCDGVDTPASYIITSGYTDSYFVFNGDDLSFIGAYNPLADGMNGTSFATLVQGLNGPSVVFRAKPAEGGHAEMYSADAFTSGDNLVKITDLKNEGLADTVPAYNRGVAFIGAQTGTGITEVMTLMPGSTEPDTYRSPSFEKFIGGDVCETREWASPAFSNGGKYFAAGWFCKDTNGPDIPSYTTILSYNTNEEECGDPLFEREGYHGIQDVCFTYDGSMVLFSIGQPNLTLEIYAAPVDASEEPVEITSAFNDGDIINFDTDPTSGRIVFNNISVNPNLYVVDYEINDKTITFGTAQQITTEGTFRRPRWVKKPSIIDLIPPLN